MANNYGQTAIAQGLGGAVEAQSTSVINITKEHGPWLVTLLPIRGPNGQDVPGAANDFRARVEWGAGGVRMKTDIDWPINGSTFVVVSESLSVMGIFNPGALIAGGQAPQLSSVQFSAFTDKCGNPSSAGPPRRTVILGAMPAGSNLITDVPNFSKQVRFSTTTSIKTQIAAGAVVVQVSLDWRDQATISGPGLVEFGYDPAAAPPLSYGLDFFALQVPVVVPSAARRVRADNGGTLALANVRLIYDLDFG